MKSATRELRALERACAGDPVLLGKGNVVYRMDDLVRRRRNASLAGQHRDTQRLDKEIMLLRASLGLPQMPPEEVIRTHTTSKDPTNGENLVVASAGTDLGWMRRVTTRGLAALASRLEARGYEHASSRQGPLTVRSWSGVRDGSADVVRVATLGMSWVASVTRNGRRVDGLSFTESADEVERGIPLQMAASTWDGRLDAAVRQRYARDWARFVREA